MTRLGSLAVLAVAIGILAGLLVPQADRAAAGTVFVTVLVHEGGNKFLTCGWHSSSGCGAGGSGALDWDNGDGADAFWRSWVILSSSATPAGAIDARPVDASGTCYAIRVDTYDMTAVLHGYVYYGHQINKTGNFNVLGDDSGYWESGHKIGETAADETTACKNADLWDGSHVHMSGNGYSTHNQSTPSYYPNDSTCKWSSVTTDCGTKSSAHTYQYHMLANNWSY